MQPVQGARHGSRQRVAPLGSGHPAACSGACLRLPATSSPPRSGMNWWRQRMRPAGGCRRRVGHCAGCPAAAPCRQRLRLGPRAAVLDSRGRRALPRAARAGGWAAPSPRPRPAPARGLPSCRQKMAGGPIGPGLLALGAVVENLVERLDGQAVEAVRKAPCAVPATDHVFRCAYGTI